MKHLFSIIVVVLVASFLLVNFPMLGIVESSVGPGHIPGTYLYFYGLWVVLILIYYLLFRKIRE